MTARPTFPTGHEPSSDEFSFLLPLTAYKPSDTSRANTSTLANDPDLFISPVANAVYAVQAWLITEGGTVGDMKVGFAWPAGATFPWGIITYPTNVGSAPISSAVFMGAFGAPTSGSSNFGIGGTGAGAQNFVPIVGMLTMGNTAGSLNLQWAQSTSDGTAAIMKAGSVLIATRLS